MVAEKGRAANTVAAYRRDLTAYCAWLERRGATPLDVEHAQLVEFVGQRRRSGAATSSIARQLAAVRMLHRYLSIEGERRDDPAAELAGVRVPSGIPKPLSEAQVTSLIDAVVITDPIHRRDLALIELLYATGARISEAVGLSIGEIDIEARLVRLYGKGSKERIVPFGSSAAAALDDWFSQSGRARLVPDRWRTRGDAEAVFLNRRGGRLTRQAAWLVIKKYGARAGIGDDLSPTCAATFVRDAPPRSRRGPASGPGDARPRGRSRPRRSTPRSARSGCGMSTGQRIHAPHWHREVVSHRVDAASRCTVRHVVARDATIGRGRSLGGRAVAPGRAAAVGAAVQPGPSSLRGGGPTIRRRPPRRHAGGDRRCTPARHRQDRVWPRHVGTGRRHPDRAEDPSLARLSRS